MTPKIRGAATIQKLSPNIKTLTDSGKRSKTLNEVKPVKKINYNPQSFPEIKLVQKEVPWKTKHLSN